MAARESDRDQASSPPADREGGAPGRERWVRYEEEAGIGTITIDRPPLNLIDDVLTGQYLETLEVADADRSARVLVLRGRGRGLSAGVDIRLLEGFGPAEMRRFVDRFYVQMTRRVRALSKPIIASVHGYAREGACTLAFACDMVIASEDATFGYPGVPNLAAPPGMHVWHLQRLMGRMKAAELVFTGEPIDAVTAERHGLITRVVPRERLDAETRALAARLAALSPAGLRRTRELFYRMEDMPFAQVPEAAAQAISEAFGTPDSVEARRAFNEKRPPAWTEE